MAKIKLNGDTSGYIEISAPAVSGNNTLELGPGTKILTNLDNTFTGVSTFSSDVYLGNDIYLTDDSGGYEKVEVGVNDIRVESKHIHSEFGVWTRSSSIGDRRIGIEGAGNDLLLYSNSTEKVRITSAGRVGINTNNPGANLTVWANDGVTDTDVFQVRSKTGAFNIQVSDSDAANPEWSLRTYAAEPIVFKQATTERLRITSSGEVNVGGSDMTQTIYAFQVSKDLGTPSASGTSLARFRNANGTYSQDLYLKFNNSKDVIWAGGSGNGGMTWDMGSRGYVWQIGSSEKLRITSAGDLEPAGDIKLTKSPDPRIYANTNVGLNIDGMALYLNRYVSSHVVSNLGGGSFGIGDIPAAGDGGNSSYNNWDTPKLHVQGSSGSGQFHLLGRFRAGQDADATGAQIVIHHENDRGMALQGGRSSGNRSYGAIKSLDNLSRESNVMVFNGSAGQGVDNIKFYTGTTNSTTEQFHIDSSGRIFKPNQPRFFAYASTTLTKSTGWHTYSWDHTRFNVGSHFSTSTNLFTVPVSGCYLFGAQVRFDGGGSGYFRLIISVNNSTDDNNQAHSIQDSNGSTGDLYFSQAVTGLYELSANDNVRVIVYSNSDTSWQPHSESQFWGYLVA